MKEATYVPLKTNKEKEKPPQFTWLPYEHKIWAGIVILLAIYLVIDFAILMRKLVKTETIHGLEPSYFGIPRDNNDAQWRAWRGNLDLLLLLAAAQILLGMFVKGKLKETPDKTGLLVYHLIFGAAYVGYLEEAGFIYWLLFTGGNFLVINFCYKWRVFPLILWAINLGTIWCLKQYNGFGFVFFSKDLQFLESSMRHAMIMWHIVFNMTILKMISFGMDKHWAFRQVPPSTQADSLSYRQRQETHQPLKNYNALTYYAYLLYTPLFLTGPTISFNAWISQIYTPQRAYDKKGLIKYALRLVGVFVCFEVFLHTMYAQCISTNPKNAHIWKEKFETRHLLLIGMLELFFLWFKFLVIWRFARLWALLDGVETPENMNRCVANNYSFEAFWRSWHRSFNQWLIRYLFIPLGGSKRKFVNIWVVFGFVAIWHEMDLNLVLWAWGICITMMPEMAVKWYFYQKKNRYLWDQLWFKYVAAGLSSIVVLSMILVNLIGYGMGYQGLLLIIERVKNNSEFGVMFGAALLIFANVNWMFWLREREENSGEAKNF